MQHANLLDLSNNKFVGIIPPCVAGFPTVCLASVKDDQEDEDKVELDQLKYDRVALKASNGLYWSNIGYVYSGGIENYIQPVKEEIDHFSVFEFDYNPNRGTITLKANNGTGRYVARDPSDDSIIKPLSIEPRQFRLIPPHRVRPQRYNY